MDTVLRTVHMLWWRTLGTWLKPIYMFCQRTLGTLLIIVHMSWKGGEDPGC